MNIWIKTAALYSVTALAATGLFAQDDVKPKAKTSLKQEEIIIRKNGDKTEKTTIVIEGEKVTVNGKPLDEYKGDDITVMRMKTQRNLRGAAPRVQSFSMNSPRPMIDGMVDLKMAMGGKKAMLGVTTQKVEEGAKILSVSTESGAEKAGLKKDDIITKVGDKKIEDPSDLIDAISSYKPADKVDITYKRDGKENKATATLKENKTQAMAFNFDNQNFNFDMPDIPQPPSLSGAMFNWNRKPKIGMQIQDIEEGKGVKVKDVDDESPAHKSGFKEGDVITAINGKEITNVDDLRQEIKDVKEGDSFKVDYQREGKKQTAEIKIPKRLKSADL